MAAIRSSLIGFAALLAACEAQAPQPAPPREITGEANCDERLFEGSTFTPCRYVAGPIRHGAILGFDLRIAMA